jgi:hypothetical protein
VREEFTDELSEILPPARKAVHYAQGIRGPAFVQGVGRLDQRLWANATQQLAHHGGRDPTLRERRELVKEPLRIPERAPPLACDNGQGLRLDLDFLGFGDLFELSYQRLDARAAEVEALTAAGDRRQDLVLLGRGEHEDDVLGRLFEHLEEGVEGLGRKHVDFVDDVDLHPAGGRREVHLVP